MKKTILFFVMLLCLCGSAFAVVPRNVLVHGSGDWIWFARVSRADEEITATPLPPTDKTEAFARQNGPGQTWQAMPAVVGRAIAMASRSSQLVLLMNDGQWYTVWSDGSATGQALPAGGRMLTITDDGENLWAIGSVPGGRAAADEALFREASTTQPTTVPLYSPVVSTGVWATTSESTTEPAVVSRLVVFRQSAGKWVTVAELPAEASVLSDDGVSMTVIDGVPIVSFIAAKVVTLRLNSQKRWEDVPSLEPINSQLADDIEVFSDGIHPILWLTHGISPGELFFSTGTKPVKLDWKGSEALDGPPAITFGGGFIRIFGPHAKKVFEQRYETDGQSVAAAAQVMTGGESDDIRWPYGIHVLFLSAMAFSVGASIYRQWSMPDQPVEPPVPAPLLPRFFAGLVDLLPVWLALIFILAESTTLHDALFTPPIASLEILIGAIAVYVIHTTLTELMTGRTAGKWLTGLRVVSVDGQPVTSAQILMRNVLRLVDPLVMIVMSPLRQRSADLVAQTMVVRASVDQQQPGDVDSKADPAEKK